jgi:hypothetical protein
VRRRIVWTDVALDLNNSPGETSLAGDVDEHLAEHVTSHGHRRTGIEVPW